MIRCDYSAPIPASGWCALWGCKPAGQVQQPFEVMLVLIVVVVTVVVTVVMVLIVAVVTVVMIIKSTYGL